MLETKAYLIHQYPYQENHAIVKMLTQQRGMMAILVKQVKSRRSLTQVALRPFTPLVISFQGRALPTLRSIEALAPGSVLSGNILYCALYIHELLIDFLTEKEPAEVLFTAYEQALLGLQTDEIEKTLREFELILLSQLGYGLELAIDEAHQPLCPEKIYQVLPGRLPYEANEGYRGQELLSINARHWTSEGLKVAKHLLRRWIHHYRGGKVLSSRALWSSG